MTDATKYKVVLSPPTDTDPPTNPIEVWDGLIGINPPFQIVSDLPTPYNYGAVGDGVTDDTVAMQTWLSTIAGGAGFLKTGAFAISGQLIIGGNTTIYGAGKSNSIITMLSDFPAATQMLINRDFNGSGAKSVSSIALYGIGFSGSSTQEVSVEMVAFGGVEGLIIRDCLFRHWRRHLVTFANCNNVTVHCNELWDWGSLTPATDPNTYDGGYALWFGQNDSNLSVLGNYIHDGQWTGIHLGSPSTYVVIDGNFFENMQEAAMFGGLSHASITNNRIQNIVVKAISGHGIELGAESNNVVISGNTFNSTGLASVYLTNCFVVTVSGNTMNAPNQFFAPGAGGTPGALNLLNSTNWTLKMDRVTITGNTITDGTGCSSYGIAIAEDGAGGITNTLIADNNLGPGSQWLSAPINSQGNVAGAGFMIRDNNCAPESDLSTVSVNFIIPAATTGSFTIPGVGFKPSRIDFQSVLGSPTVLSASVGQLNQTYAYDITTQLVTQAKDLISCSIAWAADGSNGFGSDNCGRSSITIRDPDGSPICVAGVTALNIDGFTITILDGLFATINNDGASYAVGDTGTIAGGDGLATYEVLTVSTGNVTAIRVVSGSGYVTGTGVATTPGGAQPGAGSGLTLDIFSGSPTVSAVVVTAICHA